MLRGDVVEHQLADDAVRSEVHADTDCYGKETAICPNPKRFHVDRISLF